MVPGLANEEFTTPPSSPMTSRRSFMDISVQISYKGGNELQLGTINVVAITLVQLSVDDHYTVMITQEINRSYISCSNIVRKMVR